MASPLQIDDTIPLAFVRPADAAELGDVIRRAAADGHGLFPVGGRTQLHLGLPPSKPGIAVDMTAFDRVIDYPARDMTITVQAGITLGKLQETLAAENQRLPIDGPDAATLGGLIATNTSGPRRYGCGTLRDYVIGISFMTDEGQEVKAGGRVVKNVAGYDLCKLQIGALGTLGIVTQVTLKVTPRPEDQRLHFYIATLEMLPDLLGRVHASQTRPTCVDLISTRLDDHLTIHIGFEGSREAVDWQHGQIIRELPVQPPPLVDPKGQPDPQWTWLVKSLAGFPNPVDVRLAFKANMLPSALPSFLKVLAGASRCFCQAHAGNGIVVGHWFDDLTLEQAAAMLTPLRQAAVAALGNLIITRCPPAWKRELPVWGEQRGDRGQLRAVKRELDSRDLFNPGRFLV